MYQYPELMGLMRNIFIEVMEQKGITRREELFRQALEGMKADGVPDTESNRQDYMEALIDFHFASHFSPPEIENYINLARKRDKARTLGTVVNDDQATSMQIYRALREFCDIPKGEVFISREEAEGTRVALISPGLGSRLLDPISRAPVQCR